MSNVVQLFGNKPAAEPQYDLPRDTRDLVSTIADWAEVRGIDIYSPAFVIRVTDLVTRLQLMEAEAARQVA